MQLETHILLSKNLLDEHDLQNTAVPWQVKQFELQRSQVDVYEF